MSSIRKEKKASILALAAFTLPSIAISQNAQVTVSAVVESKSNANWAIQKARPAALQVAKRNAWLIYKKRPEIQGSAYDFLREQDDQIVGKLDDVCTPPVDLDQSFDKKLGQLTFRFRFECNQADLLRQVNLVKSPAAQQSAGVFSAPSNPGQRPRLVGFFVALKDDRVEEFDATVKKSAQDSASVSTRSQSSESSASDDRVKAAIKTKAKEDVTYGESSGQISEGVKRSGGVNARVQTASSAESSSAMDNTVTAKREIQSSGSRVRKSSEITRKVVSADGIQRALTQLFQQNKFSFTLYGNVAARCKGPDFNSIQQQVRILPADAPLGVPDQTRDAIMQSVASCTTGPYKYYVEGYAKIGAPGVDPTDGSVQVAVLVSQRVIDLETLEDVSTTPETKVTGSGPDETQAENAALMKASTLVGNVTLANLSSRGY